VKRYLVVCSAMLIAMIAPVCTRATTVGNATFSGIVEHVSANNIKIMDQKNGQALSFLILPKFNQVFSSDGKTTYQMEKIHPGQYVKVYYDQKAMGARHADRIFLLTRENAVKARE
jgi:hypothetical protein